LVSCYRGRLSTRSFHSTYYRMRAQDHGFEYLAASAFAAAINYPLWRISAMGQSGFVLAEPPLQGTAATRTATAAHAHVPHSVRLVVHAFSPPYKGAFATMLGMTWARAAIFWGSDVGRAAMLARGHSSAASTLVPPLFISTTVQCVNMPLVRATITLQDPASPIRTVAESLRHIVKMHGFRGLWHGVSAGILKSVPKYCVAVYVKNVMEHYYLPVPVTVVGDGDMDDRGRHRRLTERQQQLARSAVKSCVAGIAGAALTNPVDVIRNEMFKTNQPLLATIRSLSHDLGWYRLCTRGLAKNVVAVSIPIACTIFFTDALVQLHLGGGSGT
jgi:Mitochondrial carrier protein